MVELRYFGCFFFPSAENPLEPLKKAIEADKLGFDYVRFPDHATWVLPNMYVPDALTLLTTVGALTKRIRVCASVSDPYRRHPLVLAQSVATLDRITSGRAALGLGAGEDMNLAPFGIPRERPYATLREALIVIRKLWQSSPSNPVSFEGDVYRLNKAFLQSTPVQKPNPPIYVGALGPRTRRLVGELGDGWFGWIESPETFKEHMSDIVEGARAAGRSPDEIDAVANLGTSVDDDYDKAFKVLELTAKIDIALERSYLKRMGHATTLPDEVQITKILPTEKARWDMVLKAAEQVPDKAVDEVSVIGTVDECISKIERYLKSGATSVSVYTLGPQSLETFKKYSEKILPYLRETYGRREAGTIV